MGLSTNGLRLDTITVKQAMRHPGADTPAFKALLEASLSTFSQPDRDDINEAYEAAVGSAGDPPSSDGGEAAGEDGDNTEAE